MQNITMEHIEHSGISPVHVYHQILSGSDMLVLPHWHREIEINLMLYNKGHFIVDGRYIEIDPGEPLIINSGVIHSGFYTEDIRSVEMITVQIDYDFFAAFCSSFDACEFHLGEDPAVKKRIRDLVIRIGLLELKESGKEIPYRIMKQLSIVYELGALLLEKCLCRKDLEIDRAHSQMTGRLQEMLRYIDLHHTEELTLEEAAKEAGMAPTYYSRIFRDGTGIRYHDYLVQCRTRHARDLLVNTDELVGEIAMEAGFPNVKSLIESFRKYYKVTPKQYRKNHQREAE